MITLGTTSAFAGTAAAAVRHSETQAQQNVLHAGKVLRRLDPRFYDRRTGTIPNNTIARCRGEGKGVGHAWPRFICTVSHGPAHLTLLYIAQRHNGFEIRRTSRTA